jgi:hypothetical protein
MGDLIDMKQGRVNEKKPWLLRDVLNFTYVLEFQAWVPATWSNCSGILPIFTDFGGKDHEDVQEFHIPQNVQQPELLSKKQRDMSSPDAGRLQRRHLTYGRRDDSHRYEETTTTASVQW